ncbi:hypothetical protein VNO78_01251 [Psophocarpus tetragonolobus]|uniref:Uncharacterized protein n=1 Tax=Psophocarpus tetragonolobus TaxID=3891 RepID=A0AAN9T959_PSOTE
MIEKLAGPCIPHQGLVGTWSRSPRISDKWDSDRKDWLQIMILRIRQGKLRQQTLEGYSDVEEKMTKISNFSV